MAISESGSNLEASIGQRSTTQLLALLRARHEYVPDAVSAALQELRRREVSGFEVSNALDDGTETAAFEAMIDRSPLPMSWRIFWLMLPFLAITPLGTRHFRHWADAGYRRRSVQFLEAATIGFMGYLIVIISILNWT